MKKVLQGFLLIIIASVFLFSCSSENPALERAKHAEESKGDILIGAAAPWSSIKEKLWDGIEMAEEEINQDGGLLNGRKIRIIKKDDHADVTQGLKVAYAFAKNLNIIAVIGHYNSYVSLPASIVYEHYGILMLSPLSTATKLTHQGFNLVFRNIPNDDQFGKKMAEFCLKKGWKSVVIYHSKNVYGESVANAFEKRASDIGVKVVDRLSYSSLSNMKNFEDDLKYWKDNMKFDALVVIGVVPQAAKIIIAARKIGLNVPILGSDGLDTPELLKIAGKAADNTYVVSTFDPHIPDPIVQRFVKKFKKKFGCLPDAAAAQGYDALKVLATAIEEAGTTDPFKVAKVLHSIKNWKGVTGVHTFNKNGDVVGKPIYIKKVVDGHFKLLNIKLF